MSKPIDKEQAQAFRDHLSKLIDEADGNTGILVTDATEDSFFDDEWEFGSVDEDNHDILELFEIVDDEFLIEQDGYESFFVTRK